MRSEEGWRLLMVEEPAFALDAAAVSGERSIGSDDAVAGHNDRDRIGAVGCAYGSHGIGMADLRGELAVGGRFSAGNGAEGAPHLLLKGCAAGVDLEVIDCVQVAGEVACESFGQAVWVSLELEIKLANAVAIGQVAVDRVVVLGEEEQAQFAVVTRNKNHLANWGGQTVEHKMELMRHRCGRR